MMPMNIMIDIFFYSSVFGRFVLKELRNCADESFYAIGKQLFDICLYSFMWHIDLHLCCSYLSLHLVLVGLW